MCVCRLSDRRAGDLAEYFADASKALAKLHWRTQKSMEEAVADSWRWQSQNPTGFTANNSD